MSNSYAIAAATATMHDMLLNVRTPLPGDPVIDLELADTVITTKPLDKARDPEGKNQLNIFLYQVSPDAQLRNMPAFGTANGETARQPPVALKLHYLITAFGRQDDDTLAHRLLGRAMSLLQDRAVLLPADIQAALPGNDLHRQVERVRVTPHAISTEDLFKLWSVFQTQYRLSTAYEVSVVLIDSAQTRRTPLPVLRRGALDEGPMVLPTTQSPFPALTGVILPPRQPGAQLATTTRPGDVIALAGHGLAGGAVSVRLRHRWSPTPFVLAPLPGSTGAEVQVRLPDNQIDLPAGFYTVSVGVTRPGDSERVSNALPIAIVPRIVSIAPASPITVDGAGDAAISIGLSPRAWVDQSASLLVGDREFLAEPRTAATDTLVFRIAPAPLGRHTLRVRIDGVDSFAIADFTASPPSFDPALQVEITR